MHYLHYLSKAWRWLIRQERVFSRGTGPPGPRVEPLLGWSDKYRKDHHFLPGDNAYTYNCILVDLPQLADRREQLTRRLFVKMADTDNCLNYHWKITAKSDSKIISSLPTAKECPLVCAKSTRFKNHSFHTHCLTINDPLDVTVQLRYNSSRRLCMF